MPYPSRETPLLWLSWAGLETDLIFNHGVDLPGFASFPLLETEAGRDRLITYYRQQIDVARAHGLGACLESVTWMANADRAVDLGFDQRALDRINREALALMASVSTDPDICLSAQIGPRGDGYAAGEMRAENAERYHAAQIAALAETEADILSAMTIGTAAEAIGLVRAAEAAGKPIAIGFTIETDGRLPDRSDLGESIDRVDQATSGAAAYFLVNCAHPDHLARAFEERAMPERLQGMVANASRCSHAELDEADILDDGDPEELAQQLADLRGRHPPIRLLGGCCGTDMRHLAAMARAIAG